MELAELLQQWTRLESKKCDFKDQILFLFGTEFQYRLPLKKGPTFSDLALIEAVVREAIIARGWRIRGSINANGAVFYVLAGDAILSDAEHEQPAIALLKAYLAALEAQQHG